MATYDELSAVNRLLIAIGDAPVNELENAHADVASAREVLANVKGEILSVGWWFNSERNFSITPNASGEIELPNNALEVDAYRTTLNYIQRDGKLYDVDEHTFTFDEPVAVNLVYDLEWDELPFVAYAAIVAQASFEFASVMEGDKIQLERLGSKAIKAGQALKRSHLKNSDVNILNSPRALLFRLGMPLNTPTGV